MSRLSTHRPFFGKRYPISIADLQPGMIVEFSYRKIVKQKGPYGRKDITQSKRYTVMIVDPAFKRAQDKQEYTHAINLEVAPRTAILDIARRSGATMANSQLEARMVFADKLIVEGTPRNFYLISGQGKGSYRTFKTDKIMGVQLIDYNFPESIEWYPPEELEDDEN